jgi:L-seryl-tRNA(Ser) seleniumtransferase
MRSEISQGLPLDADPEGRAACEAESLTRMRTRPAINMSGILLHTGLGRARWAPSAAEAAYRAASSHAVTEFDLPSGQRGDRQSHVEDLLCELTGAEAALVVNNCAAAVVLSLAAVAKGREVILSRGQMVEIGGAFRMPDVIRESGCRLVEVGCTNKTRLKDFEEAAGPDTGAILRCSPSNFAIIGFAEQPEPADLARLARRNGALFLDDAGSGCLLDTSKYGLAPERTLRQAVEAGADLVMASGDKLLGGPQAGLILGRRKAVKAAKKHPLARAMRIDKITLAALEATLRLYREGREAEIPLWASLARPMEAVARDARRLARAGGGIAVRTECRVGGGSLPGQAVPSWAARIPAESPNELARRLRMAETPLIGRIEDGAVLLDPRSADAQETRLAARLLKAVRP